MDWQTIAAAAIVVVTLVIFVVRISRPKKKSSCGHDCGCDKPNDP
jgi:preprotein translocase subunit YajC